MTEDEMVGWHNQLNGHVFEETLGVGDKQGGLVCCSPWGRKESDTTEQLNQTDSSNHLQEEAIGERTAKRSREIRAEIEHSLLLSGEMGI